MKRKFEKLLIVDIVAFDRRRITTENAPTCHALFERYASQRMHGQPTTEVWPALTTGTNPGVDGHLLWHARLKDPTTVRQNMLDRVLDKLPDSVVTTAQLFAYFFKGHAFDVPAIPHWRRRQMDYHRLKYFVRSLDPDKYNVVGGTETLFAGLGDDARHEVIYKFADLPQAIETYPTEHTLQFLELHCFDLISHWYLDQPEVMNDHIKKCDDLIAALLEKCAKEDVTLVFLSEHGQELVPRENHIDLRAYVEDSGVQRKDYCYYQGVAVAKFWFKTADAERRITEAVKSMPDCKVKTWQQMNEELQMSLTPDWGELYVIRDAGHLFHPHDYYHPLGNLFVGLTKKEMRKRMFDPYHRGYHGYWPGQPSEDAWVLVADDSVRPLAAEARLIDFAPSMLHLLDKAIPEHMQGSPMFDFIDPEEEPGRTEIGATQRERQEYATK